MLRYLPIMIPILTQRSILPGFINLAVLIITGLLVTHSYADIADLGESAKEMTIGEQNAPLTIVEYASLGCSHCASFHHETLPQLKKDFIDTGKVKLVFRDFPLGTPALAATMIARCSGPKRYFGFVDMFFRSQSQWSQAKNPLESLTKVARFGGMPASDVQTCIRKQKLLEHIQKQKQKAYEQDGVNATPYFVIGTKKLSGGIPYKQFKKVIEEELHKVQK